MEVYMFVIVIPYDKSPCKLLDTFHQKFKSENPWSVMIVVPFSVSDMTNYHSLVLFSDGIYQAARLIEAVFVLNQKRKREGGVIEGSSKVIYHLIHTTHPTYGKVSCFACRSVTDYTGILTIFRQWN